MTTLQELMKEIKNLKPIPAVTNQLLAVVDTPDSSMEDIANVIQYDPAITASVLKTCNAAYFGFKNPAESIKDAVISLICRDSKTGGCKVFFKKQEYDIYRCTGEGHR
jgi:HD-like signal output (HDOD) protein